MGQVGAQVVADAVFTVIAINMAHLDGGALVQLVENVVYVMVLLLQELADLLLL